MCDSECETDVSVGTVTPESFRGRTELKGFNPTRTTMGFLEGPKVMPAEKPVRMFNALMMFRRVVGEKGPSVG